MKPACMNPAEYERWTFWNQRIVVQHEMASTPCQDCQDPEYVAEMRAEGRCDGVPGSRVAPVEPEPVMAELVAEGYSTKHAAAMIGATRKKLGRLERQGQAVALFNEGHSQVDIAERMGLSQSAISKYITAQRRVA